MEGPAPDNGVGPSHLWDGPDVGQTGRRKVDFRRFYTAHPGIRGDERRMTYRDPPATP